MYHQSAGHRPSPASPMIGG